MLLPARVDRKTEIEIESEIADPFNDEADDRHRNFRRKGVPVSPETLFCAHFRTGFFGFFEKWRVLSTAIDIRTP
jgi:hypothetical protein